jgi:hypothetical protein
LPSAEFARESRRYTDFRSFPRSGEREFTAGDARSLIDARPIVSPLSEFPPARNVIRNI